MNEIRAVANFWIAFACFVFAILLIWRGGHESQLIRPIPGRIVFGAFLLLLGFDRLMIAIVRLAVDHPARRTEAIEQWYSVGPLVVCALLAIWTMVRFWRNDLGAQHSHEWDGTSERRSGNERRRPWRLLS